MERSKVQDAVEKVLHKNGSEEADEIADTVIEIMAAEGSISPFRDELEETLTFQFEAEGFDSPDELAAEVCDLLEDENAFDDEDDYRGDDE